MLFGTGLLPHPLGDGDISTQIQSRHTGSGSGTQRIPPTLETPFLRCCARAPELQGFYAASSGKPGLCCGSSGRRGAGGGEELLCHSLPSCPVHFPVQLPKPNSLKYSTRILGTITKPASRHGDARVDTGKEQTNSLAVLY